MHIQENMLAVMFEIPAEFTIGRKHRTRNETTVYWDLVLGTFLDDNGGRRLEFQNHRTHLGLARQTTVNRRDSVLEHGNHLR
jgi:hypothetical protein